MKICISIKKTPQRYWANDFVRQMHGMFCVQKTQSVIINNHDRSATTDTTSFKSGVPT